MVTLNYNNRKLAWFTSNIGSMKVGDIINVKLTSTGLYNPMYKNTKVLRVKKV